jgi:hypothetical protein
MPVDGARKLKAVEAENTKLKKLVAEQALMIEGLKEIIKKMVTPSAWLKAARHLVKVLRLNNIFP